MRLPVSLWLMGPVPWKRAHRGEERASGHGERVVGARPGPLLSAELCGSGEELGILPLCFLGPKSSLASGLSILSCLWAVTLGTLVLSSFSSSAGSELEVAAGDLRAAMEGWAWLRFV